VALNSYILPGDTLTANVSTVPTDPSELAFGRLSYDAPVGIDGARVGATALYSDVRPGDYRRQFDTRTQTETFELRGSIVALKSQKSSLTLTRPPASAMSIRGTRSARSTMITSGPSA